jgi:hypothetical protein
MTDHSVHSGHDEHTHGQGCGHTGVRHEGHTDYVHDGHLHHPHEGHIDEHTIAASAENPAACNSGHDCSGHAGDHKHDASCGHERVPHGDHVDFLVAGHLHNAHADHCDDHGVVATAAA